MPQSYKGNTDSILEFVKHVIFHKFVKHPEKLMNIKLSEILDYNQS